MAGYDKLPPEKANNWVLQRSTIQLLRFHFSFFLLPIYLFALSQSQLIEWSRLLVVFFILHLLVYPSSNGYNSYMDRDNSPIGGLEKPLQPTKQLFYVSIIMDIIAVLLSLTVCVHFAFGIVIYIMASRAYSYRGIRLKRFPIIGFLTVFIFQGALIFFITYHALQYKHTLMVPILPCIIASILIGALYPLTQIYQHQEDKQDGVNTISLLLGKRGTFILSSALFLLATLSMYHLLIQQNKMNQFILFLLMLLPAVVFFLFWMQKVWKDEGAADFKHSFIMNIVATLSTTLYFITLIIQNHFE